MSVPIIDISRNEVERWISAGTLSVAPNNRFYHVNDNDGYYLVALTAVFATRWDAIWIPSVIETTSSTMQAEDWSRILDEEELSEICGNMVCHCIEIWHVVSDFDYTDDEKTDGLYAHAIAILSHCPDDYPQPHTIFDDAWTVMLWYEEMFCVPEGTFSWWYPASAIARVQNLKDLNELRLAGVADKQSNHNAVVSYCFDHVMDSYSDDIPF